MTPEQIERVSAACRKAMEAANEIAAVIEELDDREQDLEETAHDIRYQANGTLEWMHRLTAGQTS